MGVGFAYAPTMQQMARELDPNPSRSAGSRREGIIQVPRAVGAFDCQRQHRSSHDHGFMQSAQGQAQRGRGIGQRVGPMGNDETLVLVVGVVNGPRDLGPVQRGRLRTVDQRVKGADIHRGRDIARCLQRLDGGFEHTCTWGEPLVGLYHADRSTGVNH